MPVRTLLEAARRREGPEACVMCTRVARGDWVKSRWVSEGVCSPACELRRQLVSQQIAAWVWGNCPEETKDLNLVNEEALTEYDPREADDDAL